VVAFRECLPRFALAAADRTKDLSIVATHPHHLQKIEQSSAEGNRLRHFAPQRSEKDARIVDPLCKSHKVILRKTVRWNQVI
jgi:hypothetical protein